MGICPPLYLMKVGPQTNFHQIEGRTGIVGIFLPLLPTTPFVLLAAILYARSSKRFYNWLLYNRLFGRYIRNYLDGKGIPLLAKVISISLLWITLGTSAIFFVSMTLIRIILLLVGIGVSIHILIIPTLKVNKDE